MLLKMAAIAQRLGAVLMSDDGEIYTVTADGKVTVVPTEDPPPASNCQ